MCDQFRHVKSDAARANDGDAVANRLGALDGVDVSDNARMIDAFDVRNPWANAGCDDNLVIAAGPEKFCIDGLAERDPDASDLKLSLEVTQRLMEFLLARNSLGKIKLSADFIRLVE